MPDNITDPEENRLLDLSLLNTDKLALMAVLGTDSAAGTEVNGGNYARQTTTWGAASNGSKALSAAIAYTSLAATDVQGWAIYDNAGTNRKWYGLWTPRSGSAQAAGDTITSTAHGLANGAKIVFQAAFCPTGLTPNTTYYVVGASANTFQVATSANGSVQDITADTPAVSFGNVLSVSAGATLNIAIGALSCSLG